jgi:predicted nucleotidyltransferase
MERSQNPNLETLLLAVQQLGALVDEMVFLGGSATGLLITDPAASPIRVTKDVDAIVQVVSHADYYKFSDKLRSQGFKEDVSEGAPICRWIAENVILDVMPTDTRILGFGNKWYIPAMENSVVFQLSDTRQIRIVSAPYFLITKLEAFDGRGDGDYQMSHDMEDIIAVLDGRPEIIKEINQVDRALSSELSKRFRTLLLDSRFVDSVSGHLPPDDASQARVSIVIKALKEIAGIE